MKKSLLWILTRPCFIHIGVTLASNPGLLNFAPTMPTILPTQRTLSLSLFSIFQQTMVKEWRGAGGQVWKGRILSLTKNSHRYSPAQTLYFLTHYTATKNSFTLLEIIIGQEKIHGWSAHSAFGRRWCPQRDNPIPCQKTQPAQIAAQKGWEGWGGGGGGV